MCHGETNSPTNAQWADPGKSPAAVVGPRWGQVAFDPSLELLCEEDVDSRFLGIAAFTARRHQAVEGAATDQGATRVTLETEKGQVLGQQLLNFS